MRQRETAAEIDEAAAAWVARLDRSPLTAAEEAELQDWLDADIRRQGAFAKAQAVLIHADKAQALGPAYVPARPAQTRRRMLVAGGAIAASLGVGIVGAGLWASTPRFTTRRGEIRIVPLADGSSMTLNTASKVVVQYSAARRDLQLIEGEALFEVAHNPARPFIVNAGDVKVRAVGTSFTVRRMPGVATQVLVREGVVEITHAAGPAHTAPPIQLAANHALTVRPETPPAPVALDPAMVARALAWREGMIAFEGVPLQDAAAEFARYSDPRIVLDDSTVAHETVTGLFSANDPAGFAQAAALSMNLNVHTTGEEIHLSR